MIDKLLKVLDGEGQFKIGQVDYALELKDYVRSLKDIWQAGSSIDLKNNSDEQDLGDESHASDRYVHSLPELCANPERPASLRHGDLGDESHDSD